MTNNELYYTIQQRTLKKEPTSVVRMGDGEAIVLNGYNDESKLQWVFNRQLGYIPTPEQVTAIQNNLVRAYSDADYIGVPQHKREGLNPYWYRCMEILEEKTGSLDDRKMTSVDFHNDWLAAGYFDKLLEGLDTLCYISCRNLDDRFRERFGIKNIHSFIIAPEMKFTPGYAGEKHYPDQYQKIKESMRTIPIPGNLCLVGAGVVGKVYNTWFKEAGGISLDIGNVFDAWAGLVTRGRDRGVGVTDETYKL